MSYCNQTPFALREGGVWARAPVNVRVPERGKPGNEHVTRLFLPYKLACYQKPGFKVANTEL